MLFGATCKCRVEPFILEQNTEGVTDKMLRLLQLEARQEGQEIERTDPTIRSKDCCTTPGMHHPSLTAWASVQFKDDVCTKHTTTAKPTAPLGDGRSKPVNHG